MKVYRLREVADKNEAPSPILKGWTKNISIAYKKENKNVVK